MAWTLLLLCGYLPHDPVVTDRVDVIEDNHVLNCQTGEWQIRQAIFYRLDSRGEYQVVDWRLRRDGEAWELSRDRICQQWVESFWDRKNRCWRRVSAPCRIRTWTGIDPEVAAREVLAVDQRAGLGNPRLAPSGMPQQDLQRPAGERLAGPAGGGSQ